ncbi:MAG: UDP-N-acetylmuramoyl-L-alanyl-D-glutamate--2,6-diaminopimelate ligase, partial [Acidimicrobiia bacterium]|nr:UDP-N-acetylmuramoyl-L-alanyl-D-glutamate--2,6-diaminopimelate ligase [Acidimicrobiia bacterium]
MPGESVRLSDLVAATEGTIIGDTDPIISDVEHDSRRVREGGLYVAIRGHTSDGHQYLQAVSRTAAAVCVEDAQALDVPQLVVRNTRQALGRLAHIVHGKPSSRLSVAGITGTNGKTTVTYLLESIAEAAERSAGLIGTIGARIAGAPVATSRTTPEASELHRLLAQMVADGVTIAAIEVSSHALDLFRVEAVEFSVVAFTNLSQDHLDFHGDMEQYFRAKARLFDPSRAHHAVVNTADPWGARLADELRDTPLPVTTVLGDDAAVSVSDVAQGLDSSSFVLETPQGVISIELPLGGRFNVDNAVVAAGCALGLGFDLAEVKRGLEATAAIPGRVELVDAGQEFAVLVDYAHTPEAIAAIVEETAGLAKGRVIVVV